MALLMYVQSLTHWAISLRYLVISTALGLPGDAGDYTLQKISYRLDVALLMLFSLNVRVFSKDTWTLIYKFIGGSE